MTRYTHYDYSRLTEAERYWLAAIVDGEGHIGIVRQRTASKAGFQHYGIVVVNNTSLPLLRRLAELGQGGSLITVKQQVSYRHQLWRWTVKAQMAAALCRAIEPALIAKQEQARLLIALEEFNAEPWRGRRIAGRRSHQVEKEAMWIAIKALNQSRPAA